ncbi:hypothetical protein ACH41E_06865 [Streptomyces sp. NPDC020412]|uniref:hypothetical protein n=1 Tax=Streptomyces sp. NPDC020412 TaxID=3365073 RepID=UPI00379BA968
MQIRNRRASTFSVPAETGAWVTATAVRRVTETLRDWGYRPDGDSVAAVVTLLVGSAVADGGRRVSVHVADEAAVAAIAVLSHRPGAPADDQAAVLRRIGTIDGVLSCGTDAAPDGRRVWALLDVDPTASPRPASAAPAP